MVGEFSVHVWSSCGGLNKEHSILVHYGPNLYWHAKRRGAKMNRFGLQWIDIEYFPCSNLHMNSKHAPRTYEKWKMLMYVKQPTPDQKLS